MLAWSSVWNKVQVICKWSSWCHCHPIISCFIKIQNGLIFLVPTYPACPGKEAVKQAWFMFVPLLFIYDGTWLCTCEETCIDAYQVANPELSSSERHTQSTERRFTVLSCAELLEPVVSLTDIDDDDWTSYCRKSESACRTWRCDRYCNNGICGSSINYACLSCLSNLPWPVYMPSILHCVTVWFLSYNCLFFCCDIFVPALHHPVKDWTFEEPAKCTTFYPQWRRQISVG